MKIELSRQIFEKDSKIKFYKTVLSGIQVVLCERTDGYEEVNSNFLGILRTRLKTDSEIQPNSTQ